VTTRERVEAVAGMVAEAKLLTCATSASLLLRERESEKGEIEIAEMYSQKKRDSRDGKGEAMRTHLRASTARVDQHQAGRRRSLDSPLLAVVHYLKLRRLGLGTLGR
jgi:hypothetical protein